MSSTDKQPDEYLDEIEIKTTSLVALRRMLRSVQDAYPLFSHMRTIVSNKVNELLPPSLLSMEINAQKQIISDLKKFIISNKPKRPDTTMFPGSEAASVPWGALEQSQFAALRRHNSQNLQARAASDSSSDSFDVHGFPPESSVRLPPEEGDEEEAGVDGPQSDTPSGTPSRSQTLEEHQTPSAASRELSLQEMYDLLLHLLTQFDGLEANMLSQIRQNGKEPSQEELKKFLSTDVAKENIFKQINSIKDPARKRALGYSYEIYSFAAAHCGILHDKLSTRLANILTRIIFVRYESQVTRLTTIPHTTGGIQCRDVDSVDLIVQLRTAFSAQFSSCAANTVGQPRCHAAVEKITENYCGWLRKHGITLAPSVPVFMTHRQKAKNLLGEIQRNRKAGTNIDVANMSDGERLFVEAVDDATSLADATVSFCDERFGWMSALPMMDAASTNSVRAKFLGLESMKPQGEGAAVAVQSTKKLKMDKLYSFVSEPSSPPAQLDVDFTVWDRDESTLRKTSTTMRMRPLSHGILYTYCVGFFDINSVISSFVNFFDSNHNNDCFKPLTLMYMPTAMLNEMLKDNRKYKDLHKSQLDTFIRRRCQVAKNAMEKAKNDTLYVPPTVHYEGTVNGMHATLVWASCGPISNNDSLTIVERVISGIYNLSVRGGMSMNCSKAHLDEVCCYLGQTVNDHELKDRDGNPTGIGEVVLVLGDGVKEDGDWSKPDGIDKCQCVLGSIGIECKSLLTTVDKIAAKNVASFAYDIPACLFGQSCTLYIPACFQNISPEARRDIARLQVQIEQLESLYREQHKERGVHAVFEEKIGFRANQYAKAIHKTSNRLEHGLKDCKLLPSILTALEIADIFDRSGGWMVPVEHFDKIAKTPLSSEVHFGARNPDSFVSLFMKPERKSELVEALGGLDLVINQDNWVTPKRHCTGKPHTDPSLKEMLRHKLEILPECDIEYTEDFAYKKCAEIFKGVKHVFILLDHYHEFADDSHFPTRFGVLGRGLHSENIKVEYKALRSKALDPTIVSLLKAHIESTTTPSSIYRKRCEAAVTRLFPSYGTVQKVQNYDTASMLEATAREEASVSQEGLPSSTLECQPNEASVEPPDREDRGEYRERSRSTNGNRTYSTTTREDGRNLQQIPPLDDQREWPPVSAKIDSRQERRERRDRNRQEDGDGGRRGGSRKKNKHNITKKYRTKTRKSRQTRHNKHKYKHTRTIKRRKSRRNNSN